MATDYASNGALFAEQLNMRFGKFSFGSIEIDGVVYENDVLIDRGKVRKRKKKDSKPYRDQFGHTPISNAERIPWKCRRLVIGSGKYGSLPVMKEVKREARRRDVELLIVPTDEAIGLLREKGAKPNAILHVTC